MLEELKEGFRYVWRFAPIRVLLIVMAVLSLTGMPAISVLMPVFSRYFSTYLGGESHDSQVLGFLMAASGAGRWGGRSTWRRGGPSWGWGT